MEALSLELPILILIINCCYPLTDGAKTKPTRENTEAASTFVVVSQTPASLHRVRSTDKSHPLKRLLHKGSFRPMDTEYFQHINLQTALSVAYHKDTI